MDKFFKSEVIYKRFLVPQSVKAKINEKFTTLDNKEFLKYILDEYKPNGYDYLIKDTSFEERWSSNKKNFLEDIRACFQKQIGLKNTQMQIISALSVIIIEKINQILDLIVESSLED